MKTLLGILVAMILVSACATKAPTNVKANFFVSELRNDKLYSCSMQPIWFAHTNYKVEFMDKRDTLRISRLEFVGPNEAEGLDERGAKWIVMVGNMKHEPYYLVFKSDCRTLVVGYKCWKD
jgi:hypothetical protein